MKLFNFQIVFSPNISTFIQTNANKKTTTQLLTKYMILKKFKFEKLSLIEFFDANNCIIKYLPNHSKGIINIIESKDYTIIDLSHLDKSINKAFYYNSFNSNCSKI